MTDLKIRFNAETDDIEICLDDRVVDTVGTEVVESWVTVYNEKHGYIKAEKTDNVEEVPAKEETSEDAVDTEAKE